MTKLHVNTAAFGVYVFGFILMFLAGNSLAGVLTFAFLVYLLFPFFSFILLVVLFLRFRYYENFSTEHPAKGQEVGYTLTLANESPLSDALVSIRFTLIGPDSSAQLPPLDLCVKRQDTHKETFTLKFSYRGIYKVGIDLIEVYDALGWLRYTPAVWFRTFYVYPRVIELKSVFPKLQNVIETSGTGLGIIKDYSLYKELHEYHPGRPVKHLAWKKFAATGIPYLRDYEKTSWPGVEIYLDLRREGAPDQAILEREDCSVEILVALVNLFLSTNIPVAVHAYNGRDRFHFSGNDPDLFNRFYKATITLTFTGDYSPARAFQVDMQDRLINAGTVIFITHALDPEIFELVIDSTRSDLAIFTIVNQSGLAAADKEHNFTRVMAQSETRGNIIFVDSAATIKENLES